MNEIISKMKGLANLNANMLNMSTYGVVNINVSGSKEIENTYSYALNNSVRFVEKLSIIENDELRDVGRSFVTNCVDGTYSGDFLNDRKRFMARRMQ